MSLRFLLDVHISRKAQSTLRAAGHVADMANQLGMADASDEEIFEFCLREQYLLLMTRDRFRDRSARQPSLRAMANGLTLVVIRFPRRSGTADEEARLVQQVLPELEKRLVTDPEVRRWTLSASENKVTQGESIDEVLELLAKYDVEQR